MDKSINSEPKDLGGKPLWMIDFNGHIFINASAAKDAAISVDIKSLPHHIS